MFKILLDKATTMGNKIVETLSSNGVVFRRTKQTMPLPPPIHLELRYFFIFKGSSFNRGGTTLLEGVEEALFGFFWFVCLSLFGGKGYCFSGKESSDC